MTKSMTYSSITVCIPVCNEQDKIAALLDKLRCIDVAEVIMVNDHSTDGSAARIRNSSFTLIDNRYRRGIGSAIRTGIEYAIRKGYEVIVIMAGNGKDDPREIPVLVDPIINEGYDYIQGSRFLGGGASKNLPLFRLVCIKLYTKLFTLITGFRGTDVTNGFRAYRLSIFSNPAINIRQDWLGTYELEYYIHHKVITLGYKIKEVPVSKVYPADRRASYSKIQPVVGWWRMIKAIVFLTLNIKN